MAPISISPAAQPIEAFDPQRSSVAEPAAAPDAFGDALGKALAGVESLQRGADRSAEQVALGGGNLHETALALEKADTAMRLAVKVRNKIVDAYQEIMRMGV